MTSESSALCIVKLPSYEIECSNDRFVVENECLIDILDHKVIPDFSNCDITIPSFIEILGPSCS
jgi:hypothetical protein